MSDSPNGSVTSDSEVQSSNHLNAAEMEVVFFIERFHASMGRAPSDEEIKARYGNINDDFLKTFKVNPLVLKSMKVRGIFYPAAEDRFTAAQMAAASAMLSYADRRSDEKKLRDLGITTREWATWLQNDEFAEYLNDRAERMLANTTFEAHLGLLKGIRNGNVASIALRNKMTGRFDPDAENNVDVKRLVLGIIEIIQKNVKDPVVMHQIATDVTNLASRETMVNAVSGRGQQQAIGAPVINVQMPPRNVPIPQELNNDNAS